MILENNERRVMVPYIGICDFPSAEQALRSADHFDRLCTSPKMSARKLMVGVMMSYKTLRDLPTKWKSAWPNPKEIHKIFENHPRVLNTLHYADFDGSTRASDLIVATSYGGENIHAIQLDMIWPSPEMIQVFKHFNPNLKVILQVNGRSLNEYDHNPVRVAFKIKKYGSSIDGILLDKSHGKGLGMDALAMLPFIHEISNRCKSLTLAVAGGLGPETIHLLQPIVKEFPQISIDAQGRLRQSGNSLDPINWGLAHKYLVQAVRMFS